MTVKHVRKLKDRSVQAFLRTQEGVSALEYAILVAVIAVTVGAALVAFSGSMIDGDEYGRLEGQRVQPRSGPGGSGAFPVLGASVALARSS